VIRREVAQIRDRGRQFRLVPRLADRGQENADEQRDDAHDDQELDDRERPAG